MFRELKLKIFVIITLISVCSSGSTAQDSLDIHLVDGYQGYCNFSSIAINANYLFAATGSTGFVVIENPESSSPEVIYHFEEEDQYISNIFVDGDNLVTLGQNILKFDFSNPSSPEILNEEHRYLRDHGLGFQLADNRLFTVNASGFYYAEFHEDGSIVTHDLNAYEYHYPRELQPRGCCISNHILYYFSDTRIEVWDIRDLRVPTRVTIPDEITNMQIEGIHVYTDFAVIAYDNQISLLEISEPNDIHILDTWEWPDEDEVEFKNLHINQNRVLADAWTETHEYFLAFDFDLNYTLNFQSLTEVDLSSTWHRIQTSQTVFWPQKHLGVKRLDISEPDNPNLIDNWNPVISLYDFFQIDNYLVFNEKFRRDLFIYELGNHSLSLLGNVGDISISRFGLSQIDNYRLALDDKYLATFNPQNPLNIEISSRIIQQDGFFIML